MGEKLGLICRQIHTYRAIAFAAFAGKTQIKRFFYLFALPSIPNDFAFCHLPEQVCAPAGGVLLFARHAKAGTHHPAFVTPALPHSYTSLSGAGKAAMILRKLKGGLRLPRPIIRPEP